MTSATPNNNTPSSSSSPRTRLPSPWSQIVRGESDPITAAAAASPSSPQSKPIPSVSIPPSAPPLPKVEAKDEKMEESGKKQVWKKPSNGTTSEVPPVMGASLWPTLSETANVPQIKPSFDSLRSSTDVPSSSVSMSQGTANVTVPATKQGGRGSSNSTSSNSRQRSFKKNNNSSGSANGSTTASQGQTQGSLAELPSQNNHSPRGQKNGSQNHGGGGSDNNQQQRDSSSHRNQNGNNHHHGHGGGRRNNQQEQWSFNRSFNGREGGNGGGQSQRGGTPAFVRHAPPPVQPIPPQFIAAQPVQPFGSPVPFPPEFAAPYYPRMPFMGPIGPMGPSPVFYHVQDPPLNVKLQKQIHYYFSEENLITDIYLRGFMDDQGFVPLRVIAGFKKVAELTDNIQQIVEALQGSPFVEVQGEKIRKRHTWQNWLLPKAVTSAPAASSPQSGDRVEDAIANKVGNLSLDQATAGDPTDGSSSNPRSGGGQEGDVDPVSNHKDSDGANH